MEPHCPVSEPRNEIGIKQLVRRLISVRRGYVRSLMKMLLPCVKVTGQHLNAIPALP